MSVFLCLTLPGPQAVPWATVAGSDTSSPRWKKVPLQTRSLWLKRTVVVRISALVPSRGRSLPPWHWILPQWTSLQPTAERMFHRTTGLSRLHFTRQRHNGICRPKKPTHFTCHCTLSVYYAYCVCLCVLCIDGLMNGPMPTRSRGPRVQGGHWAFDLIWLKSIAYYEEMKNKFKK